MEDKNYASETDEKVRDTQQIYLKKINQVVQAQLTKWLSKIVSELNLLNY